MSRALLSVTILGLLSGCPTPPTAYESTGSTNATGQQQSSTDAQGQQSQQNNTMMDLSQVTPQKTQEQIKSEEHVSITGTISGSCTGKVRIDVISDAPPTPGAPMGPLTNLDLAGIGAYTLLVPTGTSARLAALCDNDGDNKISAGKDGMSKPTTISEAKTDQKDVNITIEEIPTQPAQGGGQGGGGQMGGQGGGGQMGGQMGGQGGGQMGGQGGGQMGGMGGQGGGQMGGMSGQGGGGQMGGMSGQGGGGQMGGGQMGGGGGQMGGGGGQMGGGGMGGGQ